MTNFTAWDAVDSMLTSIIIFVWNIIMIGGSVYLYGWLHWSGWWVFLGILLAASAHNTRSYDK